MSKRPDFVKEEYLVYLDDLRNSGITNMYGARPYLIGAFALDKNVARDILSYWMESFSERHPKD